jgi:hypothetical protein
MSDTREFNDQFLSDRADQLARLGQNSFTRHHGVMDDAGLAHFLEAGRVLGTGDFANFEVLFGFDEAGNDFLIVKNRAPDGRHLVLVKEEEGGRP